MKNSTKLNNVKVFNPEVFQTAYQKCLDEPSIGYDDFHNSISKLVEYVHWKHYQSWENHKEDMMSEAHFELYRTLILKQKPFKNALAFMYLIVSRSYSAYIKKNEKHYSVESKIEYINDELKLIERLNIPNKRKEIKKLTDQLLELEKTDRTEEGIKQNLQNSWDSYNPTEMHKQFKKEELLDIYNKTSSQIRFTGTPKTLCKFFLFSLLFDKRRLDFHLPKAFKHISNAKFYLHYCKVLYFSVTKRENVTVNQDPYIQRPCLLEKIR